MAYFEIEDLGRIIRIGKELNKLLRAAAVRKEMRTVGYPKGHTNRAVVFLQDVEEHALWYCHWIANDEKAVNLFGHGEPGSSQSLNIDVQFNYRVDKYSRGVGAALLENPLTGEVVLAHRGIVTRGSRVNKDAVFEAMASRIVEAETTKGKNEFLVIASLRSATLTAEIGRFALDLRRALRELKISADDDEGAGDDDVTEDDDETDDDSADGGEGEGFDSLREYFKEFSGKRRSFKPKKTHPESHHGTVVDALKMALESTGETLKSRAIGLVVNQPKLAILFEVKTDANSQNVYTAIGQLCIHTTTVKKFTGKKVKCVMVVPERPMGRLANIVEQRMGVFIVTFKLLTSGKVTFNGLEQLSS
jgi:hypothetical protein